MRLSSFKAAGQRLACRFAWLALTALLPLQAWAAGCSPYIGKVTLNEYNYIDNFTEVKRNDTSVSTAGWQVAVYTGSGKGAATSQTVTTSGSNSCYGGMYNVNYFSPSQISQNADIVLLDSGGNVVDFLRVRTSLPVSSSYYTPVPSCSFIPTGSATDLLVSSANKGVDRLPDGTGPWRNTPGTGSNSFATPCGPNVVGGSADLQISKAVNFSTVVKGTSVTFTVTVLNKGIDAATNVLVGDLLPGGLAYQSSTVTAGSYNAATGLWSVGNLAVGATATLTITATTTLAGSLTNTATVASDQYDPIPANNSASASVTVASPGATLDTVEVGAAPGTNIKTKLAGVGFNLDLVALDASGNIATSYNRTVAVELVDGASSTGCATMTRLQWVGSYAFTTADKGRKTATFSYPYAAPNVRVRMVDNSSPAIVACSSDVFAIRPLQFTLTTGVALNPTVNKLVAGNSFVMTADPGVTTGYNGTPLINTALVTDHNGVAVGSALTWTTPPVGGFPQAVGAATSNSFQYQDVGTISLAGNAVSDSSFTAVDQAAGDCIVGSASNTLAGGLYGCNIASAPLGPLGRFYPDHFAVNALLTPSCSAGGFTYMDQDALGVTLDVTAKTSSDQTASRYVTPASTYVPVATLGIALLNGAATTNMLTRLSQPVVPAPAWTVGMYTASNTYRFDARNLSTPVVDGPYDALHLHVTVTDATDAVPITRLNGVGIAATASVDSPLSSMRFGRVWLGNAYGSEKLPLVLPYQVQYWNGSAFVKNTLDSCTLLTPANFGLGNYQGSVTATNLPITALSLGAYSAGAGSVNLPAPNAAGSVDLVARLATPLSMCPGWTPAYGAGTPLVADYLRGKWCGATFSKDPVARATYGIFGSSAKKGPIYLRENF